MPRAVEGTDATGRLRDDLAAEWGMAKRPVVAGGAGDNAASAVGLGAIRDGDAFLSLGTSGVLWVTTGAFRPNPGRAVHAFCHAVPETWHQMGVILSAASAFGWAAHATGSTDEASLAEAASALPDGPSDVTFLPYLSGERTPHNDAAARGVLAGLNHDTGPADIGKAVMEGVAFAVRDCLEALAAAGSSVDTAAVVGGGAVNRHWVSILATVLGVPLKRLEDAAAGAAFGAARLGRIAATGEDFHAVCAPPPVLETIDPATESAAAYEAAYQRFAALYPKVKDWFPT